MQVYIYIYVHTHPESPKAVLFESLPKAAQKRIFAEKTIATAEVLLLMGYSNVVGFHGRGSIAMFTLRFTHDYSRFTLDLRAARCTF